MPRDTKTLEAGLDRLLGDPGLCRRLGENARRKAENEFSIEDNMKQLLVVYESISCGSSSMGNKEPLISVIVPVYNGQNCLADCIDSIEKQTYENLEIIVVNDGSTDQTMAVCESLQVSYDNIKILTLNDEGVSAARNAGIEASEGDFVTFVDADDRIRPEMLRILYNSMVRSGSDVTGCRFFLWSRESEWEREIVTDAVVGETKIYDTTQYLREAVLQGNNRCWSKLYRRAVVEQVHFKKVSALVRICSF